MFLLLPIKKNKIVFDNFGGRGYGCDPKYIAEELLKRNADIDLVWLTTDMNIKLPDKIRPVKYGTISAAFELSTAKVWVDNIKNAFRVKKKIGQFYIQTWHSSLGLKKSEGDAKNLPEKYIKAAKKDARCTDLMYSNNGFRANLYRTVFWYNGTVLECGVPRNSILMNPSSEIDEKVRQYFSIDKGTRIVMYAPTFRKNKQLEIYKFDYNACIKCLEKKFSQKFVLLLRLHPNDARDSEGFEFNDSVINASMYPDMQELLAVADILITDYSGCMFDFEFTHKPVFLYAKDLEHYLKKERELYFTMKELPFQLAITEQELYENIRGFSALEYATACEVFNKKIGLKEDGKGAHIIADIILSKIK